jgi:uncharacterized protein (TIGR02246 family)
LALAGCQQQGPEAKQAKGPAAEQDLAALRATGVDEYARAYNAMDVPALTALHTKEAVRMGPDGPAVAGADAIGAKYRADFASYQKQYEKVEGSITAADARVAGDWAYMRGGYLWTGKPKTGAPLEVRGKWLAVYRRQPDGAWKIHRVAHNPDAPIEPGSGQQASGPTPSGVEAPAPAGELAALKAATLDKYVQAYNAGDAAALAALNADDAVIMPTDAPLVQGKAAIEASFQKNMETRKADYRAVSLRLAFQDGAIQDDWAYVRGASVWTGTLKSGAAAGERRGKVLTIYQRQPDGNWKAIAGCSNRDHPRMPPPKQDLARQGAKPHS